MRLIYIISILFFFPKLVISQNLSKTKDSIAKLKELTDNSDDIKDKFYYARLAIKLSKETKNDSIILVSNRTLSSLFLRNGFYDSIKRINKENLEISRKLKDTLKMAYASHNLGFYFENKNKLDSAYYFYFKTRKFYNSIGEKKLEADILKNMANIQETERDYIGCEINAIEGIKILSKLKKTDKVYSLLWSLNNLIGIASEQIEGYDKAIQYHTKAISFSRKIKGDYLREVYSNINIGILYRRKKDYEKSISILNQTLNNDKIKEDDPTTYSLILSSLAYSKFLHGLYSNEDIEKLFRKSISVAEKNEDFYEIMIAADQFSEYFFKNNNKDSALYYSNKSHDLANLLNNNNWKLKSLLLKSKIEEGEIAKKYLYEHIKLNDSLVLAERSIRNKFARINFETDEIKQENRLFEEENTRISKKNQMLIITSIGLLITLFFLYIIKTQREKNKELQLAQQQQEANEEIYNLMLSQQDKMDEARALEKQRISQELHDGILGRLFGARLSLDSLNLSKTEDAVANRGNYINELKVIEQDIRKVSHDLNTDFIAHSGFLDIIETLVETQTLAYNLESTITADQDINWDAISNKTKIHFYRIVQESLQNIYKHAEATRVDITFKQKNNLISLAIKDNGSGFDENKAKKGIGLKNMRSRVKEIKGVLNIKTKANLGTTIEIRVPN